MISEYWLKAKTQKNFIWIMDEREDSIYVLLLSWIILIPPTPAYHASHY